MAAYAHEEILWKVGEQEPESLYEARGAALGLRCVRNIRGIVLPSPLEGEGSGVRGKESPENR